MGTHLDDLMGANGLGLSDIVEDWQGEVQTTNGLVKVRTLLNLYKELTEEYTPENVERLTHVKEDKIRRLTNDIVEAESTGFLTGMGMNMYFHNDLINRAYYVVATLSGNVGKPGGNIGSYAGNYKAPVFNGLPSYAVEDPFDIVGTPVPVEEGHDNVEEMARCVIEEYMSMGWSEKVILHMFKDSKYQGPNTVYRVKGEEYVLCLMDEAREKHKALMQRLFGANVQQEIDEGGSLTAFKDSAAIQFPSEARPTR